MADRLPSRASEPAWAGLGNVVLSFYLCVAVTTGFIVASEHCQHWFVVPVFLCGVLIGIDAMEWFRGQVDVLDPKGMLGLFGLHFFFLAPLLHVALDSWLWEIDPPPDWRPWIGWMAILNLPGIVIYRAIVARLEERDRGAGIRPSVWAPRQGTLVPLLCGTIILGTLIQVAIYAAYGGISGYVFAFETHQSSFLGVTWAIMVAGRVPLLALMAAALYLRERDRVPSWIMLWAVLVAFTVLQILFGGLRGQRSDIIFALFLAVGVIHYWIRPIPKRVVFVGLCFLMAFMYVYGFYKVAGVDGIRSFVEGSQPRTAVADDAHHSIDAALLEDLGRSDIQALVLYRITRPESDFSYALGRTYLSALIAPLPGPLWRDRPPTKVREGWDVLYGARTYEREFGTTAFSDRPITTRIFGLAGEAMLNFGPYVIPLFFAFLGLAVGWTRRRIAEWQRGDVRLFLAPLCTTLCFLVLTADSDNIVYYFQTSGAVVLLILFLGSVRGAPSRITARSNGQPQLLPVSTS
jgi:hypothetical protein